MSNRQDDIELISGAIHSYLIEKYFQKKEIIYGHSLMSFIQFYLLCKEAGKLDYFRQKMKITCTLSPGKINSFLNSSSQDNRSIYSNKYLKLAVYLKELITLVKINFDQHRKGLFKVTSTIIQTSGNDFYLGMTISRQEAELIYLNYVRVFKEPSPLIPSIISRLLPLRYYSGKFVYNDLILGIFQQKHNRGKEIIAVQHGGHNYVSSIHNYFLFPEYGFFGTIITAGSMPPEIRYSFLENHTILHRRIGLPNVNKCLIQNEDKFALIFGQRIVNPVRIDGNPSYKDISRWDRKTKVFLSGLNLENVIFKLYPGQHRIYTEKFKLETSIIAPDMEYCYENADYLVSDHYGTTFLKSLFKGFLCVLLLDFTIFYVTGSVKKLIEPFVIEGNGAHELRNIVAKWNAGELEEARSRILKNLYSDPSLF